MITTACSFSELSIRSSRYESTSKYSYEYESGDYSYKQHQIKDASTEQVNAAIYVRQGRTSSDMGRASEGAVPSWCASDHLRSPSHASGSLPPDMVTTAQQQQQHEYSTFRELYCLLCIRAVSAGWLLGVQSGLVLSCGLLSPGTD